MTSTKEMMIMMTCILKREAQRRIIKTTSLPKSLSRTVQVERTFHPCCVFRCQLIGCQVWSVSSRHVFHPSLVQFPGRGHSGEVAGLHTGLQQGSYLGQGVRIKGSDPGLDIVREVTAFERLARILQWGESGEKRGDEGLDLLNKLLIHLLG